MRKENIVKVVFNPDAEMAEKIRQAMLKKEGYCPCRLQRIPENVCMCQEFRDQIADPDYEGFCHCRLYYKYK